MKKFLKKNIIVKMVSIVLVAATVMGIAWNESFVKTKASGKVRNENTVTCGDEEEMETPQYSEEDIEDIEMVELADGGSQITISLRDGSKVVTISNQSQSITTYYDSCGNVIKEEVTEMSEILNDEGISDEDLENQDDYDYDPDVEYEEPEDRSDVVKAKINYKKALKETYKNKYWYRKGSLGSTEYYRIGCKAKYEIKVSSKDARTACENYSGAIKKCRNKMTTASSIIAGAGLVLTIIDVIIVLINVGVGSVKAIVEKLIEKGILKGAGKAVITAVTSAVGFLIGAKADYDDVEDYYITARTYGKKYK